jgi:hypothetical protein
VTILVTPLGTVLVRYSDWNISAVLGNMLLTNGSYITHIAIRSNDTTECFNIKTYFTSHFCPFVIIETLDSLLIDGKHLIISFMNLLKHVKVKVKIKSSL